MIREHDIYGWILLALVPALIAYLRWDYVRWCAKQDEYEAIEKERDKLRVDVAVRNRCENSIRSDLASLNEAAQKDADQIETLTAEKTALAERIEFLTGEGDTLRQRCRNHSERIDELDHAASLQDQEVKSLKEQLATKDDLLSDRDDTINKLTAEMGELESTAMQFTDANARLRKELEAKKSPAKKPVLKVVKAARPKNS